jgi:branched-chain amino acid transport system substrate-binding protein
MKWRSLAALLAVLALVAACAGADTDASTTTAAGGGDEPTTTAGGEEPTTTAGGAEEPSGDPIVFAASLPLTGEFSISGTKHRDGYQFCVDEINARGGLLDRQVELIVEDNRSDPEVVITQTERFINVEGADIILGTFSSLLGFPASTVAYQAGMVHGLPSSAALRIWERGYDNIFYFQQNAAEFTGNTITGLIDHYTETGVIAEPPQTAAIVYADDFFAGAIAKGFTGGVVEFENDNGETVSIEIAPLLDQAGMELVFEETWPVGFSDWLTLANSIATADADFLSISTASAEEAISLIQALQTVGYSPDLLYASQGNQAEFGEALGDAVNGVVTHSVWSPAADFPGTLAGEPYSNADFVAGFTEAFGTPPDEDEAIPFGVCQGMEQAILGTGGTDNSALIEWLHGRTPEEPVTTVVGSFVWDERGLPIEGSFLANQWQDGELAYIYPVGEFPGTVDMVYPKPEW